MAIVSNVAVKAELQRTREVNATRVKDQLYIFTGTYPLYYKGDGNVYLFPEHETTYIENVISGHNTMGSDFDDLYYRPFNELILRRPSQVNQLDSQSELNTFKVRSFDFTPKLPFVNVEDAGQNQISVKFSLDIPQDIFGSTRVLRGRAFQKPSLPGSRETADQYIELESPKEFFFRFFKDSSDAGVNIFPLSNANEVSDTFFARVDLNNIPVGLRDFLFVFEIYDTLDPEVILLGTSFSDIREVTITTEKIQNYPNEDFPERGGFTLRAPWTANKVLEHYGHLFIWGSQSMKSTLFISDKDDFSYFPFLYSFNFETDENQALNSVVPYMNILVVQSDSYTWGIKGTNPVRFLDFFGEVTNPNAYQPFSINSAVGTIAPKSVRPVRNRLYFLSQEGLMELTSLFATDDRYNVRPLDTNIRNLIPLDRRATAIQFDDQYWINFPETKETFRYYIDKQAWVKDTHNQFSVFNGIYRFYNKDGKLHFITHPMSRVGESRTVYEAVVDESLATDFDLPIESQFLTSKMSQEYPFHWKRYQELKLDFAIQNEYMPNRAPLQLKSNASSEIINDNVVTTFSGPFVKQHSYTVAYNELIQVDEEDPISVVINNGFIQGQIVNGMIKFTIRNTIPELITIVFPKQDLVEADIEEFTVVDATYDNGIEYDLRIMADNNTLIRDDFKSYAPVVKTIETGSQFDDITFGSTNFGDVTTFVQTTKLYGSGYDINMYYKDASNIKWTLETIGITYKMRRTRSDRIAKNTGI